MSKYPPWIKESPFLKARPILAPPSPPPHPRDRVPSAVTTLPSAALFLSTCAKGAVVGDECLVVVRGSIPFQANAIKASGCVVARCVVPTDHTGSKLALIFICGYIETTHRKGCHSIPWSTTQTVLLRYGLGNQHSMTAAERSISPAPPPLTILLRLRDMGPSLSHAKCVRDHKRNPTSRSDSRLTWRLGNGDAFWTSPHLKRSCHRPGGKNPAESHFSSSAILLLFFFF